MLDEYNVGYLCGGKLSESLINSAYAIPEWQTFTKRKNGKRSGNMLFFPTSSRNQKKSVALFIAAYPRNMMDNSTLNLMGLVMIIALSPILVRVKGLTNS